MLKILWQGLLPLLAVMAALVLVWESLAINPIAAALLTLLLLAMLVGVWWRGLRPTRAGGKGLDSAVVLVGGPAAARLFPQTSRREGLRQHWLLAAQPDDLPKWSAEAPVLGLIIVAEPDAQSSLDSLEAELSPWRHAWQRAQRRLRAPLPASLLVLGPLHGQPGELIQTDTAAQPATDLSAARRLLNQQLERELQHTLASTPERRFAMLRQHSLLAVLARHVERHVLPRLLPEKAGRRPLRLLAIDWIDSGACKPHNPWLRESVAASGLLPAEQRLPWPNPAPLPEDIAARFPLPVRSPVWLRKASLIALWGAIFFAAFSASSAWNNLQLIRQSGSAIQAYRMLKPEQEPLRGHAAQRLHAWQAGLTREVDAGVPLKLDTGLYQGFALARIVNDAVRDYQPPKPSPEVVRLDNTALFDTGKAALKPQAKLALQSVLVWIQANPGKRVLIDGHTDSTGNPAANMALSFARAQSVKTWLVSASTFAETHFAVQGLGDTQPLAGNDDEAGRSQNRRVEITLIQPPA